MNGIKVRKKKNKFVVMRSRSLENMKFGHFTYCFAEDGNGLATADRLAQLKLSRTNTQGI